MKSMATVEGGSECRACPVIGLHLDLKYVMPRKEYLLRWLDEISALGINTLLLEYEDKFPWAKYPFLRSAEAWTPVELGHFLSHARRLGLRVVPLVQTLSHLEFALAHEELAHLREMPDIPTQIDPSNPEAIAFIDDLIDEVLAYHEPDEWFHIGADEAWFLGTSPVCAGEVKSMGPQAYWARHTLRFVERLIKRGRRPVVWDDVLWHGLPHAAVPPFPREVILMSWDYAVESYAPAVFPQVDIFQRAGFDVIGAPCLSEGVLYPEHEHALGNVQAWAAKTRHSALRGLVNTSWACHHTPLPTQMLYVAATAALLSAEGAEIDEAWQEYFLRDYFDAPAHDVLHALSQLGANYAHRRDPHKPITSILYGCMDMALGYRGGQDERARRGQYPLDWGDIDFVAITQTKIEILQSAPAPLLLLAKLNALQRGYEEAEAALSRFAGRAQKHHEEARLLALFAAMKVIHARITRSLVFGEDEETMNALAHELETQKVQLIESLTPFFEPASVQRFLKIWHEPAEMLMRLRE